MISLLCGVVIGLNLYIMIIRFIIILENKKFADRFKNYNFDWVEEFTFKIDEALVEGGQ